MSGWSILFWLIISFLLLHPLNRWIYTHVQGVAFLLTRSSNVALWIFWVLFLPGTLLHELSHWITAKLLAVKTRSFSLWPQPKKSGELQMGAVQIDVTDPFRHSVIGVAPLVFGSVAVLLIGYGWLELDQFGGALLKGDLREFWQVIEKTAAIPDVWLGFYLMFVISNAMLPSASDRESWQTVFIYLGLAFVLAVGLGLNPSLPIGVQQFGLDLLVYLLAAFVITIALDLLVVLIILLLETALGLLLGRRVQYSR